MAHHGDDLLTVGGRPGSASPCYEATAGVEAGRSPVSDVAQRIETAERSWDPPRIEQRTGLAALLATDNFPTCVLRIRSVVFERYLGS